jgi:hypothetical protein
MAQDDEKANHFRNKLGWTAGQDGHGGPTADQGRGDDEKSRRSSDDQIGECDTDGEGGGREGAPRGDVEQRPGSLHASSALSRNLSVVPRSRRRGLFGRFAVIPEVEQPYEYKNGTKWTITAVTALAGAGAPLGSSIFYRRFASRPRGFGGQLTDPGRGQLP